MSCPVMTRSQQQHMLNVLADLYGQQCGLTVTFTLKDDEQENAGHESGGCKYKGDTEDGKSNRG